ncbi:type VI secretion system protein TssA [Comamonas sp. MYb21]|uniref:type VI secretion system protein TssA n=1 Tax=unclassified Comamonas TaxID=2638500 RepID=UPI0030AA4F50
MEDFKVDVDWAAPISDREPAGKNAEFDTSYAELETAVLVSPEQQYGDMVIAAKDPDWQQVLKLATTLSAETKDLRVMLWMTRALTRMHGLHGLHYGLQCINTVCEHFWQQLHPQLEIDGEADPHMRYSVLSDLGDVGALVADMRQSVLLPSHLGAFSIKDLERLMDNGSLEVNGVSVTQTQIGQIVQEQAQSNRAELIGMPARIIGEIGALQQRCLQELGSEYEPNLQALTRPLEKIRRLLDSCSGPEETLLQPNLDAGTNEVSTPGSMVVATGPIQSRRDAVRQLELACQYLEQYEPTNPAPLLVRRAIKVMEMSFMDIVKNMAPDGLNQAMFITGAEASED